MGIFLALALVDGLLIGADLLRHQGVLHDVRFAVTVERGYGEWFQYGKTAAVAVFLFQARHRTAAALAWAGLFLYLLLDDAFSLHESFGRVVAPVVPLPAVGSIRPSQAAELLLFAIVGAAFAGALGVLSRRGGAARSLNERVAIPFAVLVFFGAFVDAVHSVLAGPSYRYLAGVIEDGGEMLAMSAIVAVAVRAQGGARRRVTL